jgi:hypothetical protein
MTRLARAAPLVLAGCLAVASLTQAEVAAPETTEVFVGAADGASPPRWALAHRFLLVGTAKVIRDSLPLEPEIDYRLDSDAGVLTLRESLRPGERLEIAYAWAPIELPSEFVGLRPAEPTPADSARMSARTEAGLSPEARLARAIDQDLKIGGAKTFAIEAGTNKDANVEQSLRVSVTGRIGENVRLTALLSDQNIPLQPEGNTQRLEELDEVLIRVEGPRGAATLGDFLAERKGTAFGDFERRLSGAEVTGLAGGASARGIGASARGNFRSAEFRGEEGKQGPYVLAGEGLNPTGVIVAGSERVWVDGQLLNRGETYDYVIDYSLGELEFTNRRLITADSEIAVDFEVAEQEYKRNFYFGGGAYGEPEDPLGFRVAIASEVDERDPVNTLLTDERRQALESAGDESVLVPGAVCGVEGGDYVEVDGHFEFAGRDSGTCDVSFTLVGAGQGAYIRDRDLETGLTIYTWVGEGLGEYEPGLRLTAPRTAVLADVGLRARAGKGFALDLEGALSQEDRNTLSSLDDEDNGGAAGRATLAWDSPRFAAPGGPLRLRTATSFRGEEATFAPLGRTREAFLGEVWNFTDSSRADEAVGEVKARLESEGRWNVAGVAGLMNREGLFRSERREGSFAWAGQRIPLATFRLEKVTREDEADSAGSVTGDLLRERAEVQTRWGALRPGVSFWKEDREDVRGDTRLSGRDEVEVGGNLGVKPGPGVDAELRWARRTTDVVAQGDWVRDSVGRTYEAKAELSPGQSLRARLSWIRRELDYEEGRPGEDRTTTLTRSDLSHESLGGLLRGEYTYETTSRAFTDRLAGETGTGEPTLALNVSARLRLGGRLRSRGGESQERSSLERILTLVTSETLARVEEETTASDRRRIYLLDFSRFQDDSTTVFGTILLREEITLFPSRGPFSLTARWERIDTKDNRTELDRLDLRTERRVLRARNALGPSWTLESQGTWERESRSSSALRTEDYDLRLLELREELVWQPRPASRVSGSGAFASERNEAGDSAIRGLELGLGLSQSLRRQGRLQAEVQWTHPTSIEGEDPTSRFRTRNTDELEWRGSCELKLSETVTASVTYSGRRLAGVPTSHLLRAQARALF